MIAIAACLLSVVLALVGAELPPGTSFIAALPVWLTIVGTTVFLLTTVGGIIGSVVGDIGLGRLPAAGLVGVATVLLVTVPVALMGLPLDMLVPDTDSLFTASPADGQMASLFWSWADQYLNLLPAIAGFWLFIEVLNAAMAETAPTTITAAEPGEPLKAQTTPSALARRFPEIHGKALLAIEADEHYVRLHTDAGSEHVLYRFRDALNDVDGLVGLRVHRSWWVAEDAMETLVKTGSGVELQLKGSLTVPVSQTYRRDVERAMAEQDRASADEGFNPN